MDKSGGGIPCAFDTLFTKSVPHILEKIFFSLDYESFKICKEVSITWNKLLTSESFKRLGKSIYQEEIERGLHQASWNGNFKEVRNILASSMVDVNCIGGSFDRTTLGVASLNGHKDVIQLLLDSGAKPNKARKDGNTPLHEASIRVHTDAVKLLLEGGADPNKANENGGTPLQYAVLQGQKDVVELLLDGGSEANQADELGWTPLHEASSEGHKDVVQLLLDRGVEPNQADGYRGWTPLHVALIKGHTDIVNLLQG